MRFFVHSVFLVLLSMNVTATDIRSISEFDGRRPIEGLFGEPLPASFYEQDYSEAFMKRYNFSAHFSIEDRHDFQAIAYLVNEDAYSNDVVFSAVDLDKKKVKNFLVRVEGDGYQGLDISQLRKYDHVFVMSFAPFSLQLDSPVLQGKNRTSYLEVLPPLPRVDDATAKAGCQFYNYRIRISNREPATPGSVYAWANIYTNYTFGHMFLKVEYPIGSNNFYHDDAGPYSQCSATGDTTDRFYTNSQTGRYIKWNGMISLGEGGLFARGNAYCQTPTSGSNSCYVEGTTTKASWSVGRKDL